MLKDIKDANQHEYPLESQQMSLKERIFFSVMLLICFLIYFIFFCDNGELEIDPNKYMREKFSQYNTNLTVEEFLKAKCHRFKGCQRESVKNLTRMLNVVQQDILDYQAKILEQKLSKKCQSCEYQSIHLKDKSFFFHTERPVEISGFNQIVISPVRYKPFTTPTYISILDSLRYSNKQTDDYPNIQSLTNTFSKRTSEWKPATQIFTLSVCSYKPFKPQIIEISLDKCDGKSIGIIGANVIEKSDVSAVNINVVHFHANSYIRILCDIQACNRSYDILLIALPSCQVNKIRIFEKEDQHQNEL